ncbi:MAG: NAD(+) diphosphatase [Candidatus Competibacteraceae bacterium]|uniref:NAD-capped RNA hydrolase NudC n=1 Tax=Candidatus Contendobacter odensis Run_B_J11 TaxID=1400861 RepID=A0A7U7G7Q7_9GAMM|nr:NAD(+) diphosphatase [Candidatus Contendobacter odensis]MBK8534104.1 NAD(+) diphosphatase [Candidatus Competibacteraceae bacterium]MBK8752115.1 NAD(+) diphosphatase [Candidatus Competibacteraceae bacterium]CDH43109.1 putative NADH pyrophosphatase [Candidatus Contendobacter odensis Run_B_J11]
MLMLPDDFALATTLSVQSTAPGWWFVVAGDQVLVRVTRTGVELPMAPEWPFVDWPIVRQIDLGVLRGRPCYAVEAAKQEPPSGLVFEGLRGLWMRLEDALIGVAGQALQLIEWDRNHGFCGRCGVATQRRDAERARHCPACGLMAYPRLSPVVMVRITREREILLARAPRFAPGVYSVLAGFVEAGETLEQALHREVAEEVNLRVRDLRYFASQSWPFPHSLMVAFTAEYADGELQVDGQEILDARWFTPDQLPGLPSPLSMAWRLIQDFLAQGAE